MTPLDLELQLQQHGHALRSLARDLARDPGAADDLVQATLQCALDKPPERPGSLGGWLATVMRRLHLQRRRGEHRRDARERAAAKPELVPSTVDQLERRETLRAVTLAVFALDEPYQTTLLQRYFENLTPAQIAARTTTSVATVKSRLQRGLLLLRARLDRALGDRQRWLRALGAATGLPFLTTTAILTTGALLMGPMTKLAGGAAAALLLGALVWTLLGNEPAPVPPIAGPTPAPAVAAAATTELDRRAEPDRLALPVAAFDDDALLHPFAYELEVVVQDRLGLPVAGAKVLLAPPGCTLDEVPERTDADGRLRIRWRGRTASMPMVLAVTADETAESMRQLEVSSGAPARAVFGGGRSRRATFRLVSSGKDGNFTLAFEAGPVAGDKLAAALVERLVLQADTFADNPRLRDGLHPFASFADVQLPKRQADGEGTANAGPELSFAVSSAEVRFTGRIAAEPEGLQPLPTRLEGIVYGEDGKPCAKCPVAWGTAVDRVSERTETDQRGAFRFDNVAEGRLELRAGGGDAGLQHLTVATMKGQTTTTEVQLRREATVRGRAVAADGKPLAGFRVEWVGAQAPWFDACTVADDGSFVLPNLPGGGGQLLLWHKDNGIRLPLLQLANVLPDNGDTELRLDAAAAAGTLQLEPLLPDGVDQGAVEVRIFQEDSGRGTTLQKLKDSNTFALRSLAAGWYRLEIGGPGLGWLDAGRHFVDGKGVVDLGRVALLRPGTLRLQLPEGVTGAGADDQGGIAMEIYRRRADCDVRIEDAATMAGTGTALPLPPGDYFYMWRSPRGAQGFTPFTVQTGRETAVQCMDRDVQAWHAEAAGPARERR